MTLEETCSTSGSRLVCGDIELCRRRSPSPQPGSSRPSQAIAERELVNAQPDKTSNFAYQGAIVNDREGVQCASPEHGIRISMATPREVESLRYERTLKQVLMHKIS